MTECNRDVIKFRRRGRRHVQADFNGGRLVSDGGLALVREVDQCLGLTDQITEQLTDRRNPLLIQHELGTMVRQRVHGIVAGYEDINDHDALRSDPMFQLGAGVDPLPDNLLASPPTLSRLENAVTRADCVRLHEVLVTQFIRSFDEPPDELTLDFDATDDPLHGEQEGRFFHGYYRGYCYLPLYVFCGDELLVAYLRPSDIDASKHTRAILKLLVDRLRATWPDVKITLRGDAGFCRWRLMRWCDRHDIDYILGLARNKRLERMTEWMMEKAEADFEKQGVKQRQFHKIEYAAGTWDRPRRVIVKAERLAGGPNRRFVVTNHEGDPQAIYDNQYCARGEMENRIKEQQLGLFADRTSCSKMVANQFRLLLSSFAYTLLQTMRRTVLPGTRMARAQVTTIRLRLIKIAAHVTVSARRVVLHLSSTHPDQPLFRRIAQRLAALTFDTR